MAYRVVKDARAWWPVTWTGVTEDGDLIENSIELRFRRLKVDAASAWLADVVVAQAIEAEPGADLSRVYAELVARIATDWRGVEAENGDPLRWDVPDGWLSDLDADGARKPLDAPNVRLLMNEGGMFTAIFKAFRACLSGEEKIRSGN